MATTSHRTAGTGTRTDTSVQRAAQVVGATFLLVGILGFIPGVTSNLDTIAFMGHESDAKLLGLFQVSVLHNIVHLLFGVAGLAMARRWDTAKQFLIGGGAIYLVLSAFGAVIGHDVALNFVPLNGADDLLHLALGTAMVGLGIALGNDRGRD